MKFASGAASEIGKYKNAFSQASSTLSVHNSFLLKFTFLYTV